MKYLVIYNPNASNGIASKKIEVVRELLAGVRIDYDMVATEGPGHAGRLAEEHSGEYECVVAAGGDGTINETIGGLMRGGAKSALGVLAIGRGNDFAFGANIPRDLAQACKVLKSPYRKKIDIGLVTGDGAGDGMYFGNGIGIGFDTIVGLEAAKIKWAQGFLGYLIGALKTMFFYYDPPEFHIVTDNLDETRPLLQISAMNGTRMGGAFYMAPNAVNDDGFLDICIAGDPKRGEMLGIIASYMKGTQDTKPHIVLDRTTKLQVTSADGKIIMHADGETVCTDGREISIEIIPSALEICCSEAG